MFRRMQRPAFVCTTWAVMMIAACGGGGGGGDGAVVIPGDDVTFALTWEGPADLDLSLVTPGGRRVSFTNPSADGCSLDGDDGDRPGALSESIACSELVAGDYEAFVDNLDSGSVEATLVILSGGLELATHDLQVGAGSRSGPFRAATDLDEEPPFDDIEGVWQESDADLASSSCSDQLDELFLDYLPFTGGGVIVSRDGDQVTVEDPDGLVTMVGGVAGGVIDVDTTISDSGGGCSVSVNVNLTADLSRNPTTATYTLPWRFSGCPGFSDCQQTLRARWNR